MEDMLAITSSQAYSPRTCRMIQTAATKKTAPTTIATWLRAAPVPASVGGLSAMRQPNSARLPEKLKMGNERWPDRRARATVPGGFRKGPGMKVFSSTDSRVLVLALALLA